MRDIREIAITEACEMFRTTEQEIRSKNRKRYIVDIRRVITYALRDLGVVYERIGDALKKDHSTVIHYAKNPIFRNELEVKIETLKNKIQYKIDNYGTTRDETIREAYKRYDGRRVCNIQELTTEPVPHVYIID